MLDCTLVHAAGVDVNNQSLGINCVTCGCKNKKLTQILLDHFLESNNQKVCYTYELKECGSLTILCTTTIYQHFLESKNCETVTIQEL